jgi:hypothetical protein
MRLFDALIGASDVIFNKNKKHGRLGETDTDCGGVARGAAGGWGLWAVSWGGAAFVAEWAA